MPPAIATIAQNSVVLNACFVSVVSRATKPGGAIPVRARGCLHSSHDEPSLDSQTETEPGAQRRAVALRGGLPALLDEHVLQPDAQRVQFLPESVNHNVGLIHFVACLLASRE
jgi:hypothetical protein